MIYYRRSLNALNLPSKDFSNKYPRKGIDEKLRLNFYMGIKLLRCFRDKREIRVKTLPKHVVRLIIIMATNPEDDSSLLHTVKNIHQNGNRKRRTGMMDSSIYDRLIPHPDTEIDHDSLELEPGPCRHFAYVGEFKQPENNYTDDLLDCNRWKKVVLLNRDFAVYLHRNSITGGIRTDTRRQRYQARFLNHNNITAAPKYHTTTLICQQDFAWKSYYKTLSSKGGNPSDLNDSSRYTTGF